MESGFRLTERGEAFIREWTDGSECIVARTSGSTGVPKTISLLKSDMRVSARATNCFFGINAESVLVCPLSADYIAGKMMIVRALEARCRLYMAEPSNNVTATVSAALAECGRIDLLPLVPSQCDSFLAATTRKGVRHVIVGGAPVSQETEARLVAGHRSVWATYGMTETCSHVAVRPIGSQLYEAMPGITFSADGDRRLAIDAPSFSFRRIQTNDIVELTDSTHFRWLGRADNVINSGGIKIFPEQLERQLAPYIPVPFYFKGEDDPKWGTRLVLVAECDEAEAPDLMAVCREHLPAYHVPKAVRLVSLLPQTPNGKLRRL
ncbi:MAG: AMP-binding protein [Muribaculaceae bacterium]|nr:AMP-binding protein [Muribaculaceae bacterium]